jgi:ribosomal protein S25
MPRKKSKRSRKSATPSVTFTAEQKQRVRDVVLKRQTAAYATIQEHLQPKINLSILAMILRELDAEGVTGPGERRGRVILLRPDGSKKTPEELASVVINVRPRGTRKKKRGAHAAGKFTIDQKVKKLGELALHYGGDTAAILSEVSADLKKGGKLERLQKRLDRIHLLSGA